MMGWTMAIFMMWFVMTQPSGAAGVLQSMGNMMQEAAEGMASFVTSMI